jgi:hypothetical protein
MTGGLIQLVAYGVQDLFLTNEPQITFFKVVYRRHTNFSTESIKQNFTHKPDFGRRVTAILSRNGDLIRNIQLVAILPRIPMFKDENNDIDLITKFAWVRRVGYAIIKSVEIEIGGELMDKQYGDWLNIWNELTIPSNKNIDRLLGDVKEVRDFSNGKDSYKLFIPLKFWFNRFAGLALPVVSLQYNHVKINLEINDFNKCHVISPTHIIRIDNDFVNFESFEFLEQIVDGVRSLARFVHFDIINRELYIWRITDNGFLSLTEADPLNLVDEDQQDALLYERDANGNLVNAKYLIKGLTSEFEAMPLINAIERIHRFSGVEFNNIVLKDAFLLVEYVFLDVEERVKFSQSKHEYLIEQILFNGEKVIDGLHQSFKLGFTQPCKELIWVTQLSLAQKRRNNDLFNYTDSMVRDINEQLIGENIVSKETLLFNGQERLSFRDHEYFSWLQPYQYHQNAPNEGINSYSFSLFPEKHQPSGSANLSKIDNILLRLSVIPDIDFSNTAKLRVYCVVYNILRVANGISGLVFSNDIQI